MLFYDEGGFSTNILLTWRKEIITQNVGIRIQKVVTVDNEDQEKTIKAVQFR